MGPWRSRCTPVVSAQRDDASGGFLTCGYSGIGFRQAFFGQIIAVCSFERRRLGRQDADKHIMSSLGGRGVRRAGTSLNFSPIRFVPAADCLDSVIDGGLNNGRVKETHRPWPGWRCFLNGIYSDSIPIHHGVATRNG